MSIALAFVQVIKIIERVGDFKQSGVEILFDLTSAKAVDQPMIELEFNYLSITYVC